MEKVSTIEKNLEKNDEPLTITRVFEAPRELVWKAWTDPELFVKWWGPRNFTSPSCKMDLRVGGKYLWCMRSPDGKDFWNTGVYREIAPPSLLVMTESFADEKGNVVPSTYYGLSPDFAAEMVITVRLQEIENKRKTRLILTHSGLSKTNMKERSETDEGWNDSFDKLTSSLSTAGAKSARTAKWADVREKPRTVFIAEPGIQEITIAREFDAPRELVFRAFTDPALYVKWLGPRGYSMKLEKFEPKSGGSWRYIHKDQNGNEFGFHGVYHEVKPPERMVDTFEFEGLAEAGHVSLEIATFEALPRERTKLTIHAVYLSVADRDGMVSNGMESGLNDSFERLTELLAEIKQSARKAK